MEEKEELRKYRLDIHLTFAVAQHYGLRTHYIDFTTDPMVAAFFATHSKNLKKSDPCTIIFFDKNKFRAQTEVFQNNGNISKEEDCYPELVEIDVDNLWRLQAQRGVFLYSPFKCIDQIYPCFTRIQFPFESPYAEISEDRIYPVEKSRLEILIDQFFFVEDRLKRVKRLRKFATKNNFPITHLPEPVNDDIPVHRSWRVPIKHSPIESWFEIDNSETVVFDLSSNHSFRELQTEVSKTLRNLSRSKNYAFEVRIDKTACRVSNDAFEVWHGLRNQHYSYDHLTMCFTNLLYYGAILFGHDLNKKRLYINWRNKFKPLIAELLEVEFGELDNSYARSFVSAEDLFRCLRKDVADYFTCHKSSDIPDLLLRNNNPKQLFERKKFERLFIEKILPVQKIVKHNPAVYYNVSDLSFFGLA
jgi:hypothetical protein